MENVKCAICSNDDYEVLLNSKDYRYRLSEKQFTLVKCKKCGLVYLNPRPTQKEIRKFYPKGYYNSNFSFFEKLISSFFIKIDTQRLMRYKNKGRLLDLGCGTGSFLLAMKRRGFKTFGVDVSKNACEIARKNGVEVLNGKLDDQIFQSRYFEVITLWHVFEHLHNPASTLKEISRILKKDGILVIEVPNIDNFSFSLFKKYYFHLDLPRHLHHWSPKTIEMILNKNGFKVLHQDNFSLAFPLSLFHSFFNFLHDFKIKSPFMQASALIASPFLIIMTLFLRVLPAGGETLKIYAIKNK